MRSRRKTFLPSFRPSRCRRTPEGRGRESQECAVPRSRYRGQGQRIGQANRRQWGQIPDFAQRNSGSDPHFRNCTHTQRLPALPPMCRPWFTACDGCAKTGIKMPDWRHVSDKSWLLTCKCSAQHSGNGGQSPSFSSRNRDPTPIACAGRVRCLRQVTNQVKKASSAHPVCAGSYHF